MGTFTSLWISVPIDRESSKMKFKMTSNIPNSLEEKYRAVAEYVPRDLMKLHQTRVHIYRKLI